jgi:hypothetical protein
VPGGAFVPIAIPIHDHANTSTRRMPSVATDQKRPLFADEADLAPSAIENEIPTYRAISKYAVFSLLFGIIASFSFASLYFLVFAVAAVILGILAHLGIKQFPDMLTGRGLANAGIAFGLVFGLVVTTYTGVTSFILTREAQKFGEVYAKVLTDGGMGDILWYGIYPESRKDVTPADALKEYEQAKPKEKMFKDQKIAPLNSLKKRLAAESGTHLHFVDIEQQGVDESGGTIVYFATALYEVEGAGEKGAKQYALAIFKGVPKGRHYDWWVDDVRFPYEQKTFAAPEKPVDDGHGHAQGSH